MLKAILLSFVIMIITQSIVILLKIMGLVGASWWWLFSPMFIFWLIQAFLLPVVYVYYLSHINESIGFLRCLDQRGYADE